MVMVCTLKKFGNCYSNHYYMSTIDKTFFFNLYLISEIIYLFFHYLIVDILYSKTLKATKIRL